MTSVVFRHSLHLHRAAQLTSTSKSPGADARARRLRRHRTALSHFRTLALSHHPTMPITTINPATGEEQPTRLEKHTPEQVDRKLALADEAFRAHRRTPIAGRTAKMAAAGEILSGEKEKFARIMTMEMGKTFKAAIAEAEKCAWACRYYAGNGARFLADEEVETKAKRSY